VERVCRLLLKDIEATLGPGHDAMVREEAARVRKFVVDPSLYVEKVVEDVQQIVHDCHLHTTWPTCPRHPNHPLWFHGDWWCCDRDRVVVAALGDLHRGN
jgi:hypothetical protein